MNIKGFVKTTLIDYPGKIACLVFTGGCNYRCVYCHNAILVTSPDKLQSIDPKEIFDFLDKRKGKLEGVVVSGGEPTIHSDLYDFIKEIKNKGYAVKLDTNGTNPDMVEKLLNDNLIDFVGIDYKGPYSVYQRIVQNNPRVDNVHKTLIILKKANIPIDVRTTVHKALLKESDIELAYKELNKLGITEWYLQQFNPGHSLAPEFDNIQTYSDNELIEIASKLGKDVKVRSLLGTH